MLKSLLQQLPLPLPYPFPLLGQLFPPWQEHLWVQDQLRAWPPFPREVSAQPEVSPPLFVGEQLTWEAQGQECL